MKPEVAASILNVDVSASREEVQRAFRLRSRMTHPDLLAGAPASEIAQAAAEFIRISDARDALLSAGPPSPEQNREAPATASSTAYERDNQQPSRDNRSPSPPMSPPSGPPLSRDFTRPLVRRWTRSDLLLVILTMGAIVGGVPALAVSFATSSFVSPSIPPAGSTWSGVDTYGVETGFTFNADGSVDVSLDDKEYADPGDTWNLDGEDFLNVHVNFDGGTALYRGRFEPDSESIEMSAVLLDERWRLRLTK